MERTNYQAGNCSIASTVQVLGEKWTLLIIRESFYGATRFEQFHACCNARATSFRAARGAGRGEDSRAV
jgi:DNA-binding HxlR family transcriptional regulator